MTAPPTDLTVAVTGPTGTFGWKPRFTAVEAVRDTLRRGPAGS